MRRRSLPTLVLFANVLCAAAFHYACPKQLAGTRSTSQHARLSHAARWTKCKRTPLKLSPSSDGSQAKNRPNLAEVGLGQYVWFFSALPSLSLIFPSLVEVAQAASVGEDRRFFIVLLLILKRVYLYFVALSTLDVAARRSVNVLPKLGERLQELNRDIFGNFVSSDQMKEMQQSQDAKAVYSSLDEMSPSAQAAFLPAFLLVLLLGTFVLLNQPQPAAVDTESANVIAAQIKVAAALITPLANAALCFFFTSTELNAALCALRQRFPSTRRLLAGEEGKHSADHSPMLAAVAAGTIVAVSSLSPVGMAWPLQNTVNACVGVTVARALQLPKLSTIALALGGLVFYDVAGVYFLQPAGAEPAAAAAAAASAAVGGGAQSVMESVAKAKLAGGLWQPGLFTVVLNGKVTDALGLADVVFPAILAGWAHRRDRISATAAGSDATASAGPPTWPVEATRPVADPDHALSTVDKAATAGVGGQAADGDGGSLVGGGRRAHEDDSAYLSAAMGGYAVGCFACEVFNSGAGQPALLFLVPPMFSAVLLAAGLRGELSRVWG